MSTTIKIAISLMMLCVMSKAQAADVAGLQGVYDKTQAWQADFTQTTYVALIDKTITKMGSIIVSKPAKLKIDYRGEDARHYVSNGDTLWVYDEGVDQVLEYKKISQIMASEALTFLKGLGNLEKDFKVKDTAGEDAMMQNKKLTFFELQPHKKQSQIEKIILGVSKSNQVEELTLFNESGNKSHYQLSNIVLNPKVDEKAFELDKELKNKIVKGE